MQVKKGSAQKGYKINLQKKFLSDRYTLGGSMKLSKHISLMLLAGMLTACAAPPTAVPVVDINSLNTAVAQTAFAAQTQSAVPGTSLSIETGTSTPTFDPGQPTLTATETLAATSLFSGTPPIPYY